jgi:hypothetical protein
MTLTHSRQTLEGRRSEHTRAEGSDGGSSYPAGLGW